MKKIIFYILVALLVVTVGCNDDDNSLPVIKPEKTGTVTIGENTYGWARYAGLDWMTSNFKEGTPYYELTYIDQYGYTNDLINDCEDLTPEEWDRYGNLYSYEEAKANAPEGWRLPTDEDWKKLERAMGMSQGDADAMGFPLGGYAIVLGRPATLRFRHWREFGYFWTATEEKNETPFPDAYYRKISFRSSQIERGITRIVDSNYETNYPKHMSVRYVRDAVD